MKPAPFAERIASRAVSPSVKGTAYVALPTLIVTPTFAGAAGPALVTVVVCAVVELLVPVLLTVVSSTGDADGVVEERWSKFVYANKPTIPRRSTSADRCFFSMGNCVSGATNKKTPPEAEMYESTRVYAYGFLLGKTFTR